MENIGLGGNIPGLDDDDTKSNAGDFMKKKVPYAKPVPKMFEAAWAGAVPRDAKPPFGQPRPPPPGTQVAVHCVQITIVLDLREMMNIGLNCYSAVVLVFQVHYHHVLPAKGPTHRCDHL